MPLFPLVHGENVVHIVSAEVVAYDETLQVKLVISFCVGCDGDCSGDG